MGMLYQKLVARRAPEFKTAVTRVIVRRRESLFKLCQGTFVLEHMHVRRVRLVKWSHALRWERKLVR